MTAPDAPIRVLHVVRRGADCYPLRIAERAGPADAVLLLGDGVYNRPPEGLRLYAAAACAAERGVGEPPGRPIEDAEVVALLFGADKVLGW